MVGIRWFRCLPARRALPARPALPALVALCLLCAVVSSGCGYTLAGRGSFLPDYIQTIGIPTFANRTPIFNLETQVSDKVRSEFIGRGRYRIVPDGNNVDAVLIGEVTSATATVPVGLNAQQVAATYELTMTARAELRDVRGNKVLWENPALTFRQTYPSTGSQNIQDANAFFAQDQNALERMTSEFARAIVSAILEAF